MYPSPYRPNSLEYSIVHVQYMNIEKHVHEYMYFVWTIRMYMYNNGDPC